MLISQTTVYVEHLHCQNRSDCCWLKCILKSYPIRVSTSLSIAILFHCSLSAVRISDWWSNYQILRNATTIRQNYARSRLLVLRRAGALVPPSPGTAFIIASTSSIINPIICPGRYRLPKTPLSPSIATSRGSLIRRPPSAGGAEHHTSVSPGGVILAAIAAVAPCRAVSHPCPCVQTHVLCAETPWSRSRRRHSRVT